MKKTRYVLLLLSTFFTLLSGFPHIILGAEKMNRSDFKKAIKTLWHDPLSYLSVFDEGSPDCTATSTHELLTVLAQPALQKRKAFREIATLLPLRLSSKIEKNSHGGIPLSDSVLQGAKRWTYFSHA